MRSGASWGLRSEGFNPAFLSRMDAPDTKMRTRSSPLMGEVDRRFSGETEWVMGDWCRTTARFTRSDPRLHHLLLLPARGEAGYPPHNPSQTVILTKVRPQSRTPDFAKHGNDFASQSVSRLSSG